MPEGDTIHAAARRVGRALLDTDIDAIEAHPRLGRLPERLAGRRVRAVDAHGKHLFLRFDDELTIRSHLRMPGWWGVYERGRRWGRAPRRAWLVIRTPEHEVVEFDGPVLELVSDWRARSEAAALGPDVLAEELDERAFLARVREDDPTRGVGDALLDQRNIAGIGNVWKAEGCFDAGIDPWRALRETSDAELLAVVRAVRPRMQASVERGGHMRGLQVYDRAGRRCPRCGERIRARGQGDDNRTTYWCAGCQS